MKLLKETYKTYEGARKRSAFENSLARSEYEAGHKVRFYRYTVIEQDGAWRVQRDNGNVDKDRVGLFKRLGL